MSGGQGCCQASFTAQGRPISKDPPPNATALGLRSRASGRGAGEGSHAVGVKQSPKEGKVGFVPPDRGSAGPISHRGGQGQGAGVFLVSLPVPSGAALRKCQFPGSACTETDGAPVTGLSPKPLLPLLEKAHLPPPLAHLFSHSTPPPPRPPAAPQQAGGAAGGREGPPCAAVLGAGERRPVPRALLHCADSRAAQWPVGPALRVCEPQRLRLCRGQVSRPPAFLPTFPHPDSPLREHLELHPPSLYLSSHHPGALPSTRIPSSSVPTSLPSLWSPVRAAS